jgi:hypothetical protein
MQGHRIGVRETQVSQNARVNQRILAVLAVLSLLLVAVGPGPQVTNDGWVSVGEGIQYKEFHLPGPSRVYVARMDRDNLDVTIDTMIAQAQDVDRRETVSAMAAREDEAVNSWNGTWGTRNHVVVAINGSFNDRVTGVSYGGAIHGGWYSPWSGNLTGPLNVGWTMDREILLGSCTWLPPEAQVVTFLATGRRQPIGGLNVPNQDDQLVLLTPEFTTHTPGAAYTAEVLVEMARPAFIIPTPRMALGTIREIRDGMDPTTIPFNYVVLVANGAARTFLLQNARVGASVGISLEIRDLGTRCENPVSSDWSKTYAALSGGFVFLRNGATFHDPGPFSVGDHPRTAIAFNEDYVFFVVVDGRNEDWSVGMTLDELALFCLNRLGASSAINMDGGGSSTMWVNGAVVNRPSDGFERGVADGLMMVVVEPMQQSAAFHPGDFVSASGPVEVRLGPGRNYHVQTILPAGSQGRIVDQRVHLGGVLAQGSYWWEVAFERGTGWVLEDSLTLAGSGS